MGFRPGAIWLSGGVRSLGSVISLPPQRRPLLHRAAAMIGSPAPLLRSDASSLETTQRTIARDPVRRYRLLTDQMTLRDASKCTHVIGRAQGVGQCGKVVELNPRRRIEVVLVSKILRKSPALPPRKTRNCRFPLRATPVITRRRHTLSSGLSFRACNERSRARNLVFSCI